MLKPWQDIYPDRLEFELSELKKKGIPHEIDNAALQKGRVVINFQYEIGGEKINLAAWYSFLYPYFRFEIFAPGLDLKHHQNPSLKNLCVMGRPTLNWDSDYSLAHILEDRLKTVIETGRSDDNAKIADLEVDQAEPFSDYYLYGSEEEQTSYILVDSSWEIDESIPNGELEIGLRPSFGVYIQGAVLAVKSFDGHQLAAMETTLKPHYKNKVRGRWIRVDDPIPQIKAEKFHEALIKSHPHLRENKWTSFGSNQIEIIGVIYREEVRRREYGLGWSFLVRCRLSDKKRSKIFYLAKPMRAGKGDFQARAPELSSMSNKTVALVGVGCVGSPCAVGLAQAGIGELRILDYDIVEPGITTRWPLGFSVLGKSKARALTDHLKSNFPYTKTKGWNLQIGNPLNDVSELNDLEKFLQGASLIIDTSAEFGVQHFLSSFARNNSIPYVWASGSNGGWGGTVGRISGNPDRGCWGCYRLYLHEETISSPPMDENTFVQPAGCAEPTFTAASFDMMEVSLSATRFAISTLCNGEKDGYPNIEYDVGVLSLRNPSGHPVPPTWEIFLLNKHPKCLICHPPK